MRHGGLSTTERVPSAFLGLGFISSSPFATTSGSLLVCGPMRSGLSGWFLPRFDPDRWIAVVERDSPVAGFLHVRRWSSSSSPLLASRRRTSRVWR